MNVSFYDFWQLYHPQAEFKNRYRACEQLWNAKTDKARHMIINQLRQGPSATVSKPAHRKNPYFYLADWRPPKPHWLTPAETGRLLAQQVPLAVCLNPDTHRYGTLLRTEAEEQDLEIHHLM